MLLGVLFEVWAVNSAVLGDMLLHFHGEAGMAGLPIAEPTCCLMHTHTHAE